MPNGSGPPLTRLSDGTIKQINPFTGTEVWTVPGRANRPLSGAPTAHQRLNATDSGRHCAFCAGRMLETPPEKARRVRTETGWATLRGVTAEELSATAAEFRLIPNLFEIVSLNYWKLNHGFELTADEIARRQAYLATPAGRAHVLGLVAAHRAPDLLAAGDDAILRDSILGGFHDVIVARRHHVDGARCDDELASSSTLSEAEHEQFVQFTLEGIRGLFAANPKVRNVVAFQNWLRPAGASFDHLHKQLVAIDEYGHWRREELLRLATNPSLFEAGLAYFVEQGLVIAENEHAVAVAGIGHRYPSLEVWLKDFDADPWTISDDQVQAFSSLLRDCHSIAGPTVACNEEWHYRPPGVEHTMPLRVVLKWRISTPAGFEGGSRIYINTIDPHTLAERGRSALGSAAS